jgi:hypothetical protein
MFKCIGKTQKHSQEPGMMVHACNSSYKGGGEAGGSQSEADFGAEI